MLLITWITSVRAKVIVVYSFLFESCDKSEENNLEKVHKYFTVKVIGFRVESSTLMNN